MSLMGRVDVMARVDIFHGHAGHFYGQKLACCLLPGYVLILIAFCQILIIIYFHIYLSCVAKFWPVT